jgi:hypothetical protein
MKLWAVHRVCRLAAHIVMAVIVTSGVSLAEEDTTPPAEARAECAAAAARTQRINLGVGVYTEQARVSQPLEIEIPAGSDTADYRNCLEMRGLATDVGQDRYLQAIEACRGERRERVGYRISARPGVIGGDDGLEDCIRRRMGGIQVDIEAIGEEVGPGAADR